MSPLVFIAASFPSSGLSVGWWGWSRVRWLRWCRVGWSSWCRVAWSRVRWRWVRDRLAWHWSYVGWAGEQQAVKELRLDFFSTVHIEVNLLGSALDGWGWRWIRVALGWAGVHWSVRGLGGVAGSRVGRRSWGRVSRGSWSGVRSVGRWSSELVLVVVLLSEGCSGDGEKSQENFHVVGSAVTCNCRHFDGRKKTVGEVRSSPAI